MSCSLCPDPNHDGTAYCARHAAEELPLFYERPPEPDCPRCGTECAPLGGGLWACPDCIQVFKTAHPEARPRPR